MDKKLSRTIAVSKILEEAKKLNHPDDTITRYKVFLSIIDCADSFAFNSLVLFRVPLSDIRELVYYDYLSYADKHGGEVPEDLLNKDDLSSEDLLIDILTNCEFIYSFFEKGGVSVFDLLEYLNGGGEPFVSVPEGGAMSPLSMGESNEINDALSFIGIGQMLGGGTGKSPDDEKGGDPFSLYCTDLTENAANGDYDGIFCRPEETRKIMRTLGRKTKKNPVLVGKAGTGKSTVVYGVAKMIATGEAPDFLLNKKIYRLDILGMISGTKYRGEFEEKVKSIIDRLIEDDGESIAFIDEIHMVVGAGGGSDSSGDLSNILKPYLSDGDISCIGATTTDEYKKYIEKDPALERRFQKVAIKEPDEAECLKIIDSVKVDYCKHYGVKLSKSILKYVVERSSEITGRNFPDKTIDLLDESCSEATFVSKKSKRIEALESEMHDITFLIDSATILGKKNEVDHFSEIFSVLEGLVKAEKIVNLTKASVNKALKSILGSSGNHKKIGF